MPVSSPVPELERPACPLCGGVERRPTRFREPPFGVVRCGGCGLLYLFPRLAEAAMHADYRDAGYFEGGGTGYRSYGAQEATLRETFRRLLGELRRRGLTGGRLLEIGCAYGFFLDEAAGLFAHRTGTDYSEAALERAAGRAERLVHGGLAELPVTEGELADCAALIHVIEHVYRPVELLRDLRRHLRPGGAVVVATPDGGSLWRPLMGRRWPFYKVPEHVTYFDRRSLHRLLDAAGLVDVEPIPYASVFPLDLVGEKLGLPVPRFLAGRSLALPGATIAAVARRPAAG